MPEHLECLGMTEDLIGPETNVKSGDFSDVQVPGHFTVLAHPFRMICGTFHVNSSMGPIFRQETVVGLYAEWHAPVHLDAFPSPKTVKLCGVLTPGTSLHHQIGRFLRFAWNLAEDGFLSAQCRVTEKELDEKGLGYSCLCIITCKGVPPPVVSLMCLQPVELTCVAGYIMLVESCS